MTRHPVSHDTRYARSRTTTEKVTVFRAAASYVDKDLTGTIDGDAATGAYKLSGFYIY